MRYISGVWKENPLTTFFFSVELSIYAKWRKLEIKYHFTSYDWNAVYWSESQGDEILYLSGKLSTYGVLLWCLMNPCHVVGPGKNYLGRNTWFI